MGEQAPARAISCNLAEAGFEEAERIEDADAVITYFASQSALEDAYFDTGGLVQSARKDAYLVDLSATTPGFARELNAVAIVNDLRAVEAPLLVLDITEEDAFSDPDNLVVFLAAEDDDARAVAPLLEAVAGSIELSGETAGAAQLARAMATLALAAQVVSVMEADALARACGFGARARELVRAVSAQGVTSEAALRIHEAVSEQRFSGTYTTAILMSELSAALAAADDADLILPGAEAALHLLELLAVIGGSDMAPAALSLAYADEATCAEHGLDWTRAEKAFGSAEHDHDHDDDEFGFDDDEFGFDEGADEYPGGFGRYSAN